MALDLDSLKQKPPVLKPFEVEITGIDEPVIIHAFTMDELAEMMKATEAGESVEGDNEHLIRKKVVGFLRGPGAEITDDDCASLSRIFSSWQLREIYVKAHKLNGFGPEALREAEKN
jgi:hypothetical protein